MTPYVGRVAIGTAEFTVSIDDIDRVTWSAEMGEVSSIPGASGAVFMVSLLDGPRTNERAPASLETLLPSRVTFVVGSRAFADPEVLHA